MGVELARRVVVVGGSSTTAYQRELARQRRQDERNQRLDEANNLITTFQHILELHREDFPSAARPLAARPVQPDRAAIYAHFERQALQNVGRFKRTEREQARRQAAAWADAEAGRLWQDQLHGHAQASRSLTGQVFEARRMMPSWPTGHSVLWRY